jgi:vacuolar-type H+-ATPase subunit E/Vma4
MSVDALIARMTQQAQARMAALRAGADAEVAALAEASAKASSRDIEQTLAARQAARDSAFAVEHAKAQRRAAADVLSAQHAFLDRVLARAQSLADTADADARYVESLPGQMAALAQYLGDRTATLHCRAALAARLRPLLADRPRFELVPDDTVPAGLIARTGDGSCAIDYTLATRLATLRPQLEARLLSQVPR